MAGIWRFEAHSTFGVDHSKLTEIEQKETRSDKIWGVTSKPIHFQTQLDDPGDSAL